MPKLLIRLKKSKSQVKIKKPNFYEVILLNDDFDGGNFCFFDFSLPMQHPANIF